jgi:oligopeptide/dipeptide ABC transporter ATP-binding protein
VLEPVGVTDSTDFLVVDRVSKRYRLPGGGDVLAVHEVSFTQAKGETLGVVGESGCGKSTLARLILHLVPPSSGEVRFRGERIAALKPAALRQLRRDMQMVFQDPRSSLDPRMRVGRLLEEPLLIHGIGTPNERRARVDELLDLVGLPVESARRFPHEFSGGQRQRIAIARAIALSPALIVADEPVSSLDVSIQAQILNLLIELRGRLGLTYVFISHDLAVVRHLADSVVVMYLGEIVEHAEAGLVFDQPAHPYTRSLLAAVPDVGGERASERDIVQGDIASAEARPSGCGFHPRCPVAEARCRTEAPPVVAIGAGQRHRVRCWLYG